jgi:hypothetical protein
MGAPKSQSGQLRLGMAPATPRTPVKKVNHPASPRMTRHDLVRQEQAAAAPKPLRFGGFTLTGEMLEFDGSRRQVRGSTAVIESAATAKNRMTATRVVGGFALFGPLGAVIGGMSKKDLSRIFVIVTLADGTVWTDEIKGKKESDARQFIGAVNTAASR